MRRSRLDAVKAIKAAQHRDTELRAHHAEVRHKLVTLDQEVTHVLGQIQVAEQRLQRAVQEREPLVDEAMRLQDEADRARTRLARLDKQLAEHKSNMRTLERECELWRAEIESAFEEGLSGAEEDTMKRLSEEVEAKKKELVDLSKRLSEVRPLSPSLLPSSLAPSLTRALLLLAARDQEERARDRAQRGPAPSPRGASGPPRLARHGRCERRRRRRGRRLGRQPRGQEEAARQAPQAGRGAQPPCRRSVPFLLSSPSCSPSTAC